MADTSQQELTEPHTNGVMDGLTEEEKSKMRPADIDADMREMERRKRVEMMMNSRLFREELERIIETQMKDGSGPSGLLQQISEMMGAQGARFNANVFKNSNCVVPINDIRGVESMGYAKGEKLLRCKLAAVFRLLDLYGWTQGVGGQITARLNQDQEHFLVNPYGLLYHEVTASSLVKVDMKGGVVEQGTTNFGVHVTGFQLHSTIHAARPDIKCIIHITTPTVTAVSSLKSGLLPLGQESIVIGEVSCHRYIGESVLEPEEREKITRNLGPINKVMLLTNRGALCCGETVEEAFYNVYNTVLACETQLKLMPVGLENLTLISDEAKKAIFEASRKGPIPQSGIITAAAATTTTTTTTNNTNTNTAAVPSQAVEPSPLAEKLEKRWRIGGTEFEALMRMLDNAGFRTGYIYRHPLIKGEPPRPRNDVEVPPAVSSLGYLLEEEELYKQGLWKGGRKGTDRSRWLNSPNVYQKIEIQETGTPDPKKITKWVDQNAEEWVSDGSPTHSSTPVKIESALQFVPKNTNPKEFKQLQQQIKDYRRADKISAGPQSHILEGVSWEEAKKMQDATISGTGEQVVLVGAASKGIIQRGFQHNAMVYKTPYAKNPFDAVTDQELDQYKKEVERKHRGGGSDPYDESQSESEALSSFNVSRATHESSTAKSPIQSPISVTSETEEESRDEPRVLRIETKQVPLPSQPEMVLSDAQDATSQFLDEMRRTAIEPRNEHSRNKRDLIESSYDSVNEEGRSYQLRYDVLRVKVATSSAVAKRSVHVVSNDDRRADGRLANSEKRRTNEDEDHLSADPPSPFSNRLRKIFYFGHRYDDTTPIDPVYRTGRFAITSDINDVNTNTISRCRSPSVSTAQFLSFIRPGYVRSIIERYSNLSKGSSLNSPDSVRDPFPKDLRSSKRQTDEKTLAESIGNEICQRKMIDWRVERNPEAEFVDERVYIGSNINLRYDKTRVDDNDDNDVVVVAAVKSTERKLAEEEAMADGRGRITTAKTAKNRISSYTIDGDTLNNNKNVDSSWIPPRTDNLVNGNESDENGNSWLEMENRDVISTNNLFRGNIVKILDIEKCPRREKQEMIEGEETIEGQGEEEDVEGYIWEEKKNANEIYSLPPKKPVLRQDSIIEAIGDLNADIIPSKIVVDALPKTDVSIKYNLNSVDMGLLYSLTPNASIEDDCESREANESLVADSHSSSTSSIQDEISEFMWDDLATGANRDNNPTIARSSVLTNATRVTSPNENHELSDSSIEIHEEWDFDAERVDRCSNDVSQVLELSISTIPEITETADETFDKDISTSADEIIAHLDVISEPISSLVDTLVPVSHGQTIQQRSVQDEADEMMLAAAEDEEANNDRANGEEEDEEEEEEETNRLVVIDEIVHHIVDKVDNECNIFHSKRVKEYTNIGILKEMQTSIVTNKELADVGEVDDQGQQIFNDFTDDDKRRIDIIDEPSEPLEDRQTSESTENDTKSDDGKEEDRSAGSPFSVKVRSKDSSVGEPTRYCLIEYVGVDSRAIFQKRNDDDDDVDTTILGESNSRDPLACIPEESNDDRLLDESDDTGHQSYVNINESYAYEGSNTDEDTCNATYIITDSSEEDEDGGGEHDCPYNADISNVIDETCQSTSAFNVPYDDNYNDADADDDDDDEAFDTTANLADISTTTNFNYNTKPTIVRDSSTKVIDEERADCMNCSYETSEFIQLERQLSVADYKTANLTYRDRDDRKDVFHVRTSTSSPSPSPPPAPSPSPSPVSWALSSTLCASPLKAPPRYEDTTLCRVVSNINLTDTIMSINADFD